MGYKFSRQASICPPERLQSATIIGAGHLGSNIAMVLAQMGVGEGDTDIVVYDADVVEEENTPASVYGPEDDGEPKVDALKRRIESATGVEIEARNEMYTAQPIDTPILIITVDSLEERARIWDVVRDISPDIGFVLDMRSGKNTIILYPFEPRNAGEEFEPSLKKEALPLMCSEKAVAYNASTAAGLGGAIIRNYCMGGEYPHRLFLDHGFCVFLAR